jgi:hypothetical protein
MARYLVPAGQTAHSGELLERLRRITTAGERAEFVLVVPATLLRHLAISEEGETLELARRRAADACARLTTAGLRLIGRRVGDGDPLEALADTVGTLRAGRPPPSSRRCRRACGAGCAWT